MLILRFKKMKHSEMFIKYTTFYQPSRRNCIKCVQNQVSTNLGKLNINVKVNKFCLFFSIIIFDIKLQYNIILTHFLQQTLIEPFRVYYMQYNGYNKDESLLYYILK